MIDKDAVLDFNGYMHRLNAVVSAAKTTGHKIKVAPSQIHNIFENHKASVSHWPQGFVFPVDTPTILFKHNGKYMVLTNTDKVLIGGKEDVVGLVISTVALKNCRIPDDQIPETVPQYALDARNDDRVRQGNTDWLKHGSAPARPAPKPAAHPVEFSNRPRFTDRKPAERKFR